MGYFSSAILISLLFVFLLKCFFWFKPDFFFRDMPQGLCQAKLDNKPNWVSSLVKSDNAHYIKPLPVKAFQSVIPMLKTIDKEVVIKQEDEHLIGYRRSWFFGFTDWFCITKEGAITSSATVGYSDLGNNRRFVLKLQALIAQ